MVLSHIKLVIRQYETDKKAFNYIINDINCGTYYRGKKHGGDFLIGESERIRSMLLTSEQVSFLSGDLLSEA